jgi:hypothetical protein
VVVTLHNFADRPARPRLKLDQDSGTAPVELLADQRYDPVGSLAGEVPVEGYGYRWFRLR